MERGALSEGDGSRVRGMETVGGGMGGEFENTRSLVSRHGTQAPPTLGPQ